MKKFLISSLLVISLFFVGCGDNFEKVNGSEIIEREGYTIVYFEIGEGIMRTLNYGYISNEEIEKFKLGKEDFILTVEPVFENQKFKKGRTFEVNSSEISDFQVGNILDSCEVENCIRDLKDDGIF